MKHFILLSLSICLLSVQAVSGQITLKTRPYFVGLGIAYPLGPYFTGGAYHSNGWGAVLTLNAIWTNAKNQPSDFSPGLRFYNDNLKDKVFLSAVRVLKLIPTESKRLKFGWEAGPAWVQTITLNNFERITSNALFSTNYSYTSDKKNAIGLSFRGKIEFSLSRWLNVELGFNAILNKLRPYHGVDFTATLGKNQW
ncbi:MAG: hypothetical protein ACKVT2_17985 [Saprospiraceae bacterium]